VQDPQRTRTRCEYGHRDSAQPERTHLIAARIGEAGCGCSESGDRDGECALHASMLADLADAASGNSLSTN
jgi:hypothetical protein